MSGLVYPLMTQYPIRKTKRPRTVVNQAADGSTVRLPDPAGEVTEWRLEYADLSDDEAATLTGFFTAAEGSLNGFTFLDPAANLLAWSARLDNAVWQKDPLLTLTGGVADPAGGTRGWHLSNAGGGPQGVAQTIAGPVETDYCFSVYARAAVASTVTLSTGSAAHDRVVPDTWTRLVWFANADEARFGIAVAAGAEVDVYGPQVEAQGGASVYRATSAGGVYTDAHLSDDVLSVTRTGCNRNTCTVNIIHVNHL